MPNPIKLEIPKPCHEDWDKMSRKDQGRYCDSCQKTVVDFTLMSDKQILEYFSNTIGNTCGRFANDQLDRALIPDRVGRRSKWAYILNLLVPAFLISSNGYSQGGPIKSKVCQEAPNWKPDSSSNGSEGPREIILRGIVVDRETKLPVPYATVQVKGEMIGAVTDSTGKFSISDKGSGKRELEISSIGYKTQIMHCSLWKE